ncbi:MAG: serine/threonine protein kinase [Chlamydiia bacterium]|nr:serine/threonine protein kinase [Chlamydiia bacterium]
MTLPDVRVMQRSDMLPRQIGPYKIESLLSSGGMSLLYLGLHPETHQPLAVKVLLPKFLKNREVLARFEKEAKIIAAADHPNIVKIYGQGEWEKGLYIAIEFVRGISLSQFLQKKSFSQRKALEIILQVAYALSHLHSHGVIHGDLKPENALIDESGAVKLIDFGIAELLDEKEVRTSLMGTPVYMSPEQREPPYHISLSSDIYALGVIAYELILGQLSHGAIHLELLPKPLRPIIGKALAKDSKERYPDIVDFITEIVAYLETLGEEEDAGEGIGDLLHQSSDLLLQKIAPQWPGVECGLFTHDGDGLNGLYLELFRLSDTQFLVFQAMPQDWGPASLLHGAFFCGLVRATLASYFDQPLPLSRFLTQLNRSLRESRFQVPFIASVLLLDVEQNLLTFASCQGAELIHVAHHKAKKKTLSSPNPKLGEQNDPSFTEIVDNWQVGDTLYLTNGHKAASHIVPQEWALLSPQHQAEKIVEQTPTMQSALFAMCFVRVD